MFPILRKQKLAEKTFLLEIEAPLIAKKAKAGNFVVLRIDENGERIPLTIADFSKKTITLVVLVVGKTTEQLSTLRKGDFLLDLVGPLGNAALIKEYGTVCLIAGGLGIAPVYPIARELAKIGNEIIVIMGAKSKSYLFWEDSFKKMADQLIIMTDDGSKGGKGFVTNALEDLMRKKKVDFVIAIGPPIMMQNVCKLTYQRARTKVSLNPIMVDGLGMCGCCRVVVDCKVKFACVDGPEFDGHKVDWDELIYRNKTYEEQECRCKK